MRAFALVVLVGCGGAAPADSSRRVAQTEKPVSPPSTSPRIEPAPPTGYQPKPGTFESLTGAGSVSDQFDDSPMDSDKAIIRRVVHRRSKEIKACYENRLATAPSLEGRVVVKFVISGTSGQVTIIAASGLDDAVDRCVESEFRQLVFPKTGNGKDVTVDAYPLTFHR